MSDIHIACQPLRSRAVTTAASGRLIALLEVLLMSGFLRTLGQPLSPFLASDLYINRAETNRDSADAPFDLLRHAKTEIDAHRAATAIAGSMTVSAMNRAA